MLPTLRSDSSQTIGERTRGLLSEMPCRIDLPLYSNKSNLGKGFENKLPVRYFKLTAIWSNLGLSGKNCIPFISLSIAATL